MKFYLAGAVAHDPQGSQWRERIMAEVPHHEFINPIADETGEANYRVILNQLRQQADKGDLAAVERLRCIMHEKVIPKDIKGVDECDALICYVKKGKRVFGSVCEIYIAVSQGKLIYLISELSFAEMNNWEIALSDRIFRSVDDAIAFLQGLK